MCSERMRRSRSKWEAFTYDHVLGVATFSSPLHGLSVGDDS